MALAAFNGLITNDKFCLSRHISLRLTWSRAPLCLPAQAISATANPFAVPLISTALAVATDLQKRHLVELLIDRVVVTNEDVEIR
jgi:hypothetical protein